MPDIVKSGLLQVLDKIFEGIKFIIGLSDVTAETLVFMVRQTAERFSDSPNSAVMIKAVIVISCIVQFRIVYKFVKLHILNFHAPIIFPALKAEPVTTSSGFIRMIKAIGIYIFLAIYLVILGHVIKYVIVGVSVNPLT